MPLEIGPIIWAYFVLSIIFTLIFLCWLSTYDLEQCDEELILYFDEIAWDDNSYRKQRSVDESYDSSEEA